MNTSIILYEFMYLKAYISLYLLIIILLFFQHTNFLFRNNFDKSISFIISVTIFLNAREKKFNCIPSLCFYFLYFVTNNVSFLLFAIVLFAYFLMQKKTVFLFVPLFLLLFMYINYNYHVAYTKEAAVLLVATFYLISNLY